MAIQKIHTHVEVEKFVNKIHLARLRRLVIVGSWQLEV